MSKIGMRKRGTGVIKPIVIGILLCMVILSLTAPTFAAESISVSCYIDDLFIGNVTVFNVSGAASACNLLYYDCKDKCSGCFSDFDYVKEVCVDTYGGLYLK